MTTEQRRAEIARAVFRVVERGGVRAATVRAVAAEAGVSKGSLQHLFASQDELRRFAATALVAGIAQRTAVAASDRAQRARQGPAAFVEAARELLEQVLPLDAERRTEARVYAAFVAEAGDDAGNAALREEVNGHLDALCRHVVDGLVATGRLGVGRDVDVEVERLWALLDGLSAHLLDRPEHTPPERARAVVVTHLHDLTNPGGPA